MLRRGEQRVSVSILKLLCDLLLAVELSVTVLIAVWGSVGVCYFCHLLWLTLLCVVVDARPPGCPSALRLTRIVFVVIFCSPLSFRLQFSLLSLLSCVVSDMLA